ncbi:MAG: sulfate/molybdate ABC transporter ATP-binding protein [Butyricicoccus sp.]
MRLSVDIVKRFPNFTLQTAFEADMETLGLLGGSGSGKSMTLKCIAGVVRPDEGKIVLNGKVLFDSAARIDLPPQKRQVGYLFQQYALFPNMTVEQNIRCGLPKERKKQPIADILKQFYLDGLERRYPAQLSGGQQQRTALARILVSNPAVLLLDEPFSALDTYLRGEMELMLAGLLREFDGPALLVSHNRDEIYHLCDRIAVYHNGSLDVIGEKKQVFAQPMTRTAAILTGCRNVLAAERQGEYVLYVPEWGVSLGTSEALAETIQAVGVRAHFFRMVEGAGENTIECQVESVVESPFETIVYLRPVHGTARLCWKTEKEIALSAVKQGTILLEVRPDDVLPLTDSQNA